jgi:hypothetical protein
LLTEKAYAARVFDAFAHLGKDAVGEAEFSILCLGRHFRLSERVKVVVGRDEGENELLAGFAAGRILVRPSLDVMGPTALIEGSPTEEELRVAASLVARYCDHEGGAPIEMEIVVDGARRTMAAKPLETADPRFAEWRVEDRALRARRAPTR